MVRLCVAVLVVASVSRADEPAASTLTTVNSPYCRKVRARAEADADLLRWPSVVGEVVRFPSLAGGALGPTLGNSGVQLRVGVSVAPIDIVRSTRLFDAADADCALHDASSQLQQLFTESDDEATLTAFKAKLAYLRSHREEWEALLTRGEDRLKVGVITIMELQAFRRAVIDLQRKLTLTGAEVERLEEAQRPKAAVSLSALAEKYTREAIALDRQAAGTRTLDAFHVNLTAGAIVGFDRPSEWFGQLVVSYQLGHLLSGPAMQRSLEARQEELDRAEYEFPAKVAEARLEVKKHLARTWRELQIVDNELETNQVLLRALASSQTATADHARATIALEQFSLEAERTYLTRLIEALGELAR